MQLDFDRWEGNRNTGGSVTVTKQDGQTVLEHLTRLDQKTHSQLVLGGSDSYLLIGGGNGRYVCAFTVGDNERFYNLLDQDALHVTDMVELVTGGQAGCFARRMVNNHDAILSAITYYLTHQAMHPALPWEEERSE